MFTACYLHCVRAFRNIPRSRPARSEKPTAGRLDLKKQAGRPTVESNRSPARHPIWTTDTNMDKFARAGKITIPQKLVEIFGHLRDGSVSPPDDVLRKDYEI